MELLLKATGSCDAELTSKFVEHYKRLLTKRDKILKLEQNATTSAAVQHLETKMGEIQEHLSESAEVTGGSSSRAAKPGLPGGAGEEVDVAQKRITVTMPGGIKRDIMVNSETAEGREYEEEDLLAEARLSASKISEFEKNIGVTQLAPQGKAKAQAQKKRRAVKPEPEGAGLHYLRTETSRAKESYGAQRMLFKFVGEDGVVRHGAVLVREAKENPEAPDKPKLTIHEARIKALSRIADGPGEGDTSKISPARKKEEVSPAVKLSKMTDLPDHKEARDADRSPWDAHTMSPKEYRKAVNEYYRSQGVTESIKDTAQDKANQLREQFRNAPDGSDARTSIDNKRMAILNYSKDQLRELNSRLTPHALDAEHKALVEEALASDHHRELGKTVSTTGGWKKPTAKQLARKAEEKPLTKEAQEKVQTSAINALKADKGAKRDWNIIQGLEKEFGGKFSGIEVLAFHDEDHAKRAFDSDDAYGESVFGGLKNWDDVKDKIKPGMSLEFRLRAGGEEIGDHLRAQGVNEKEIDKRMDRLGDLGDDFQPHIVTVPGEAIKGDRFSLFQDKRDSVHGASFKHHGITVPGTENAAPPTKEELGQSAKDHYSIPHGFLAGGKGEQHKDYMGIQGHPGDVQSAVPYRKLMDKIGATVPTLGQRNKAKESASAKIRKLYKDINEASDPGEQVTKEQIDKEIKTFHDDIDKEHARMETAEGVDAISKISGKRGTVLSGTSKEERNESHLLNWAKHVQTTLHAHRQAIFEKHDLQMPKGGGHDLSDTQRNLMSAIKPHEDRVRQKLIDGLTERKFPALYAQGDVNKQQSSGHAAGWAKYVRSGVERFRGSLAKKHDFSPESFKPKKAGKDTILNWTNYGFSAISDHRKAFFNEQGVSEPKTGATRESMTKEQKGIDTQLRGHERWLRNYMEAGAKKIRFGGKGSRYKGVKPLTAEDIEVPTPEDETEQHSLDSFKSPVFDAMDENRQNHILAELRKSDIFTTRLTAGSLMSGLFLYASLFKGLTLSEDQKIQAFKNSFGRGTGGVNPVTGSLPSDEDEEKDEEDEDTEKSLRLYVCC